MNRIPSLYLFVVVITLIGFATVGLDAIVLGQRSPTPANPFAQYADILPGQPKSAVVARGLFCYGNDYNYYQSEGYEVCIMDLVSGAFSQVQVGISNGVIQETDFVLRDDVFRLGDLALWLGTLQRGEVRAILGFAWQGKSVLAQTNTNQSSPFSPVWKVTFTNIG